MIWILIAALLGFSVFQPEKDTEKISFDGIHFEYRSDFIVVATHIFDDPTALFVQPEHVGVYVSDDTWYGSIMILDTNLDEAMREAHALTGATTLPSEDSGFALQGIEGEGLVGTRALMFPHRDEEGPCEPVYSYNAQLLYHYAGQSTDERFTVYAFVTMKSDSVEEIEYPEDPTRAECDEYYAAHQAQWKAGDDLKPDPADIDMIFSTMTFDEDALAELRVGQEKVESDYLEFGTKSYEVFGPTIMTITIPVFVTETIEMVENEEGGLGARWEKDGRPGEFIGYMAEDYVLIETGCGAHAEQLALLEEILDTQPEEPELPCLFAPVDGEYTDFHYVGFPEGQGIAYLVEDESGLTYHFYGISSALGLSMIFETSIPVTTLEETTLERLDGIMKSIVWPCC